MLDLDFETFVCRAQRGIAVRFFSSFFAGLRPFRKREGKALRKIRRRLLERANLMTSDFYKIFPPVIPVISEEKHKFMGEGDNR